MPTDRTEVGRQAWDNFVEDSDEAWLWHRFDLQDALSAWPGTYDLSFAVMDRASGEGIVAVVPLHLTQSRRMHVFGWNVLNSLGGPACANHLEKKQRRNILGFLLARVRELARKYEAVEVNFSLSPMAPAYRGLQGPRVNPLLGLGCENVMSQTWIINLKQGKESIWNNMESRARTAIRKGEKEGLRIRPASGSTDLEIYYDLHCETYRRTRVRPHPMEYFRAVWHDFLSQGLSCVYFAEWGGKPVAAGNFGIYKRAGIYWTGAANRQGLLLQASSLLQWIAMQWMVDHDVEWYETGEAFPHLHEGKLRGLDQFKRSFGGEMFPLYRGRMILKPYKKMSVDFLRETREILTRYSAGKRRG